MDNVSEKLQTDRQSLHEKLLTNQQVASLTMSLLGNLCMMAYRKGVPLEGIAFSDLHESGGEIRARITFNKLSLPSAGMWSGGDFHRFAKSYSQHMYKALEKNPRIGAFIEDLVGILEAVHRRKGIDFREIFMKRSFITPEGVLVVALGRETLDRWSR